MIDVILLSPDAASTFAKNGAGCIHPRNGEKICAEMAASLRSPADLAHVALLHPGQSHEDCNAGWKALGHRTLTQTVGSFSIPSN